MRIEYSERFLKDLKQLKNTEVYLAIKRFCFEELPQHDALLSVNNVKKIQGYKDYYRIRIGDYRIGIKSENDTLIIMRVMHRRDIYRLFPNV